MGSRSEAGFRETSVYDDAVRSNVAFRVHVLQKCSGDVAFPFQRIRRIVAVEAALQQEPKSGKWNCRDGNVGEFEYLNR